MAGSLFISYSRQEAPFADSLLDKLEDGGFNVWVDYQDLTPARPWLDGINRGIEGADIFLLVVSRMSMTSQFVSAETQKALQLNKRIILLIFEAVKLPSELERCEWVDFRSSFKKGFNNLLRQMESVAENRPQTPQKGFKAPWIIWLTFLVSVGVSLISLLSFWTLYIPYYLIPLPYRILKRDFNFFHVQLSLVLLPFAVFGLLFVIRMDNEGIMFGITGLSLLYSLILVPLMFFLLRSKVMRRWGKPIASRPTFANLYIPDKKEIRSVTYTIDAAVEDTRYADDIYNVMNKYGHRFVEYGQAAEVTFLLISRYKSVTAYDAETQFVYPVMLQSIKELDPKLQRIQWIDFRKGLKNIDVLAQLLPEPALIFKALGIAPMPNQIVLPPIIQALTIFLITLGIFILGNWLMVLLKLRDLLTPVDIIIELIFLAISLGTIFFTTQSLTNRIGRLASLRYIILAISIVGFSMLVLFVHFSGLEARIEQQDERNIRLVLLTLIAPWIFIAGSILILILALWHWKDLRRWSPRKGKARKQTAQHG